MASSARASRGVESFTTVGFYDPNKTVRDGEGRTLHQILALPDRELEYNHDYIQYVFPLPEASPVNPKAPTVTKEDVEAFRNSEHLRGGLWSAFKRMAKFYGFETGGNIDAPKLEFKDSKRAKESWLIYGDHNHLRISRILRCLRLLGLQHVASLFYEELEKQANGVVSPRSLMYWERAAKRPLYLPPSEDDPNTEPAKKMAWLKDVG